MIAPPSVNDRDPAPRAVPAKMPLRHHEANSIVNEKIPISTARPLGSNRGPALRAAPAEMPLRDREANSIVSEIMVGGTGIEPVTPTMST